VTHKITVKKIVNGTVPLDYEYVAGHATVSMSRKIGPGVACINFIDGPVDKDGWRLDVAIHTNVVEVRRAVKDA
jgi:hypothetical protein